jgi:MoaA/NifB/PqqE/SkfB family radical SAM enzyme
VEPANGTLITPEVARQLKGLQFAYVGISLDRAVPEVHDRFREVVGAYERTVRSFRNCVDVGQEAGLHLTLTRETCENLDHIFDLIERIGIHHTCFYHLCPSGYRKGLLPNGSRTEQTIHRNHSRPAS